MVPKAVANQTGQSTEPLTLAVSAACSPMYRVFTALKESNPTTAQAYAGAVGIARVGQGFSSLIGTLVAGVAVLITGIITMSWIALTFALYVTGLFKLAFATYSGKAKMAKEWAGDLVRAWAARLAYGILLSITILIIAWMLASTLSFGLRLVWLGVILFFFWKLVEKGPGNDPPRGVLHRPEPGRRRATPNRRRRPHRDPAGHPHHRRGGRRRGDVGAEPDRAGCGPDPRPSPPNRRHPDQPGRGPRRRGPRRRRRTGRRATPGVANV